VTVASSQDGPVFLFEHRGLDYQLPLHLESHGTRQFLRVFPAIHVALETGGIAVLDELDLAIHPLVLPEILRWFIDPRRNPHGAQIWFTCQNAAILDFLDKEEIFFCEKDGRGRSIVYGLSDVQDVRRADNFAKKYLGGRYGAVPRFG
jgi:predicted ATPase